MLANTDIPRLHKDVLYWPSFDAARAYAQNHCTPTYRLVYYGRGWAIQREYYGPYWGAKGWSN